jgi:hypothetical protein
MAAALEAVPEEAAIPHIVYTVRDIDNGSFLICLAYNLVGTTVSKNN